MAVGGAGKAAGALCWRAGPAGPDMAAVHGQGVVGWLAEQAGRQAGKPRPRPTTPRYGQAPRVLGMGSATAKIFTLGVSFCLTFG